MVQKRFKRTRENFTCEHCGTIVAGSGYTNHCPNCLYSKHVDIHPGDRANTCNGLMIPIAALYRHESYVIQQECSRCGFKGKIKAQPEDNIELLIQLTTRVVYD